MADQEPNRSEVIRRMKEIQTAYTRRERIQDRIVELMLRLGRLLSKLRRPKR